MITSKKKTSNLELRITFPTLEAKQIFAEWLSNSGEQDYCRAMEKSSTPSLNLSYHPENKRYPRNDARRYGKFLANNTIHVEAIKEDA